MKSLIAALVVVLALGSSAFAGHCGVQQVQRVVVGNHHAQSFVQFVEVPQLVVVRQQQVHVPQRAVQFVEVQKVQKVQQVQKVQKNRGFNVERNVVRSRSRSR